jgi:pyrroloquinoline quinone biosynthesis protein D
MSPTEATTTAWRSDSRPRLPSKVRVRWNAPRGQALLLYPEGALALNPTAQAVLELCDGRRTVGEIVLELAERFGATGDVDAGGDDPTNGEETRVRRRADRRGTMESDVVTFLERLRQRGWVADVAAL